LASGEQTEARIPQVSPSAFQEKPVKAGKLLKYKTHKAILVPLAGIEPALLAELDFEGNRETRRGLKAFTEQRKNGKRCDSRTQEWQILPYNLPLPRRFDFLGFGIGGGVA
jgi:hypothetical protein